MPPRIPVVFLFVAAYFAVVWGGGASAPGREALAIGFSGLSDWAPAWLARWVGLPELRLAYADLLALGAAILALPDAAMRPSRTALDRLLSLLCAGAAVGALALEPLLTTPGYAILVALGLGDALAALGLALIGDRRGPRPVGS